jgi:bifunctional DNA-binding transcriptional regulator/antitoxin component of YhaV-PrlF toxin-antitoxin module
MPEKRLSISVQLGQTKGIARRLDGLGRVTLPMEFRKELDILSDDRQWVEIFLLEDGMFIKKKEFKYKK